MEATVIIEKPTDVENELEALGLEADDLREAVRMADVLRGTFTPHHPNYYVGMAPQAEAVKVLSDLLVPKGWSRRDVQNSPRLVNLDGRVSIAIHSGDEGTGLPHAVPRTRSAKGPVTKGAIQQNAIQVPLPMEVPLSFPPGRPLTAMTTWFLLFFATNEEIRCELSLPVSWDEDEHPSAWRKRIILPSVPTGPGPSVQKPQDEVDVDVPVIRKK